MHSNPEGLAVSPTKASLPTEAATGVVTSSNEASQPCGVCYGLRYSVERFNTRSRSRRVAVLDLEDRNSRKIEDFQTSSAHGCQICAFITAAVLYFETDPDSHALFFLNISPHSRTELFFAQSATSVQIYTPIGYPRALDIVSGQELSCHGDSQNAYDFIKACRARCETHPLCQRTVKYAPTRLIDVGTQGTTEVRLIESACLPHTPTYLALSYCWGMAGVVVTTESNYAEMKRGILVSCLPQTVQDAIRVTQQVQIQYIWVDALCIIQDSCSDWEAESSEMASIYHYAHFTIAAATSDAATKGFLYHRHFASQQKAPFLRPWTDPSGQETVLGARLAPVLLDHMLMGEDLYDDRPLWTRGWTLQEYILSTRVLVYNTEELWWCCQSGTACECQLLDVLVDDTPGIQTTPVHTLTSPFKAYEYWQKTVEEYMERTLTKSEDRFPGISGIARVIQGITKSKYVAGLWSSNFIHDLTWKVSTCGKVESEIQAPSYYRAPSFSWASVEQPVTYGTACTWLPTSSCNVIRTESSVPGLNPLGQVANASVTLRGLICGATLGIRSLEYDGMEEYFIDFVDRQHRADIDVPVESFEAINEQGITENSARRARAGFPWRRPESGLPVSLLYLGRWYVGRSGASGRKKRIEHAYLMLGKSSACMSQYERLGVVTELFEIEVEISELFQLAENRELLAGFSEATITIV
ncbi:hypothetical protein BDV12DRAFT_81985 [Aspergillus spectabilis]